ncbi:MAG: TIGR03619 family F420-dependent LLM class oxidoreductase, partial [Mycobacteriales bacterium]
MLIGFGAPVSGSWATPANQVAIAQRADELGYASLWTFSRLIYSDWPEPMRLGSPYRSVHDPIVVASFLAGVTQRIRLGLAVVNAPFYPPIALAKALTSLDIVSAGRLDAGLGIGWSPAEYEATGTPPERRGARMAEYLRCLGEIWTGDPAEFSGEFYRVPRGWSDPRPVQRPYPPVLLGGTAEPALRRAGALAEGWISSSRVNISDIPASIETIRSGASEAGRDPDAVRAVIRGVARLRESPDPEAGPLTGPIDVIRAGLERYAE